MRPPEDSPGHPNAPAPDGRPLFTFRSAGWVILIAGLASLALIVWAVAPAILRTVSRPPGDGETVESYQFDLEPCLVERELIAPAMLHRDMVPVMTGPAIMPGREVQQLNTEQRGKFLVSADRVIGVTRNGESRAYPVKLLYVHEIIHDTLGGTPIAVTYHWPCDAVRVFDRRLDGETAEFAISGLLYNSNMLFYVRDDANPTGEGHEPESLWCQLEARALTGDAAAAARTLDVVPAQLTTWAVWLARHPDTTVVTEDPHYHKRYEGAEPAEYFITNELIAPVEPRPETGEIGLKDKVIAIRGGGIDRVYPLQHIASRIADDGAWVTGTGDASIRFDSYDDASRTVLVTVDGAGDEVEVIHGFWFAIHAMFPGLPLAEDPDSQGAP